MALFKSLRGKRNNLPSTKTDGYAYFCTDDGSFWIDYKDENGVLQRKQIDSGTVSGHTVNSDVPVDAVFTDTTYSEAGTILGLVKSGGDVTITDGIITVNDDSHNHTIDNIDNLQSTLDSKVDKIDGMGLSTNDYTTEEKTKLAGLDSANYVAKSGDTMTGKLTAPQIETGSDDTNYFQSRKFRGEGDANTYYHAVDFGYANHDQVDFYEYGGLWNFYKNTSATKGGTLCGKISSNGWEGSAKLTGTPTAPTATSGTNTTQIATTAFVQTAISDKVDKVSGKELSSNDYTTEEKEKLAGVEEGANKTTVDDTLSSTSTNPVQNKIINTKFDSIQTDIDSKVDKVDGMGLSTNDYTTAEKNKLAGIEASANNYSLPVATSNVLGGIKSGTDITIDSSGNVSVNDDSHNHIISNVDGLQATLDSKVDTVDGKGLSTNDLTATLKSNYDAAYTHSQQAHASADAEKNVIVGIQKNGTDLTVDSATRKVNVTVPTKTSELTNDSNFATTTDLDAKVDKVDGKGLSTNDYTTEEKTKLSGIEEGAQLNQNAFSNVVVGSTTVAADNVTDTLTLVAGDNVTLTPDATNDKITIAATDTIYTHPTYTVRTGEPTGAQTPGFGEKFNVSQVTSNSLGHIINMVTRTVTIPNATATTSDAGLMSTNDKIKLDGIEDGANKTIVDTALSATSTNPVQNQVINTKFDSMQADIDSKVPSSRTVNGKALTANITLSASDVGALPDTTVIPSIDGLATETYVDNKVAGLVDSAPAALDTLNELAAALDDDPNFATTIATQIGNKVDKVDGKGLSTNDYTTTEKSKLASIAEGAQVNQNAFSNVVVGSTTVAADTVTDTLTLVAGSNVTITPDASGDQITIASKDTVYTHPENDAAVLGDPISDKTPGFGGSFTVSQVSVDKYGHVDQLYPRTITIPSATATTSAAGLMSKDDKTKLNGIENGANNTTVDTALSSTSTNPVQNKVINTAITNHTSNTSNPHGVTAEQVGALPLSGGTLTGNLTGKYITGTWLQCTEDNHSSNAITKIAVIDSQGWIYYRTPSEILSDIGAVSQYAYTTAGDGSVYTVTVPGITSLFTGASFIMIPHVVSNSTTPTLNVNGLGEKTIKRRLSSVATSLQGGYTAGWLAAGVPFRVFYDGTYWVVEDNTKPASADLYGTLSVSKGGTGATSASAARTKLDAAPSYTYSDTDITAGTTSLETGRLYFVYE